MKKSVWAVVLSTVIVFSGYGAVFAEGISVFMNGTPMTFDVSPQIIEGRTMVPMRTVFEKLGFEVEWFQYTQAIRAYNAERKITVEMTVGDAKVLSDDATYGKKELTADVVPQIVEGRTLVPLRIVAEATGYKVEWNGEAKRVDICSTCWSSEQDVENGNSGLNEKKEKIVTESEALELLKKQYVTVSWNEFEYSGLELNGYIYTVKKEIQDQHPGQEFMLYAVNPYSAVEYDYMSHAPIVNLLNPSLKPIAEEVIQKRIKNNPVITLKDGESIMDKGYDLGDMIFYKVDITGAVVNQYRVGCYNGDIYDYVTNKKVGNILE